MKVIRKAGLLLVRDGCILLCRKSRGTQMLILPGGKYEGAETGVACLAREVREELGPELDLVNPEFVGSYSDAAAGEADRIVEIDLYRSELSGEPAACSEIAELVWFRPDGDLALLSPSLRNKILPDLFARGLLQKE